MKIFEKFKRKKKDGSSSALWEILERRSINRKFRRTNDASITTLDISQQEVENPRVMRAIQGPFFSIRAINIDSLPGREVHHFKGNNYKIITLSKDSETGDLYVVYQNKDHPKYVYHRTLEMFMSEVDRKKYPNAKQKYRFEFID